MPLSKKQMNQIWGQRLQRIRTNKSISRQEAAAFMHLSVQQIRKYETGESSLTLGRLQEFAALMGYPFSLLLSMLSKSDKEPSTTSEEEFLLYLFRQFSPAARSALLDLIQKSLHPNQ